MGCLSFQEGLIIVFVIVLIMGATRLPQIGDGLGRAIRNFKKGLKGDNEIDITPPKQVQQGEPGPDKDKA